MGVRLSWGLIDCPNCGAPLDYTTSSEMPIIEKRCERCFKDWQIVTDTQRPTEVKPNVRQ